VIAAVAVVSALSPYHARTTCRDRDSDGPSVPAMGPMRRNAAGAASSRDESTMAGRSALQRRIVGALKVSSEAWHCSGGAYKIRGASLSAKEGRGSGCALRRRPSLPLAPSRA
jgi:hypothetical protein